MSRFRSVYFARKPFLAIGGCLTAALLVTLACMIGQGITPTQSLRSPDEAADEGAGQPAASAAPAPADNTHATDDPDGGQDAPELNAGQRRVAICHRTGSGRFI